MKTLRPLTSCLTALLLLLTSAFPTVTPRRADDRESKAYHHIIHDTLLNGDSCSATAIGPHAILTATHCELGTDTVNIDDIPITITKKIRDGHDHTIYVVDADFAVWLPLDQRAPLPNERVRSWGWPGGQPTMVYAEGEFLRAVDLGDVIPKDITSWLFILPTYSGDSGAAVISDSGKILTVISLGDNEAHMFAFPLAFTNAQLQAIK